jgi:hypothetical protein
VLILLPALTVTPPDSVGGGERITHAYGLCAYIAGVGADAVQMHMTGQEEQASTRVVTVTMDV